MANHRLGKLFRGRLGSAEQRLTGPRGGAYRVLLGCGYMGAMAVQRIHSRHIMVCTLPLTVIHPQSLI